jgi:hypothetical protein
VSAQPWTPPRAVREAAAQFLRENEASGHLDTFGGAQGVVDASEAAHFLTFVFATLAWIFALRSAPVLAPMFYICDGADGCIGSGVYREPRACPNCRVECVAVDRRGHRIEAP